jgi:hypothetical protein
MEKLGLAVFVKWEKELIHCLYAKCGISHKEAPKMAKQIIESFNDYFIKEFKYHDLGTTYTKLILDEFKEEK